MLAPLKKGMSGRLAPMAKAIKDDKAAAIGEPGVVRVQPKLLAGERIKCLVGVGNEMGKRRRGLPR